MGWLVIYGEAILLTIRKHSGIYMFITLGGGRNEPHEGTHVKPLISTRLAILKRSQGVCSRKSSIIDFIIPRHYIPCVSAWVLTRLCHKVTLHAVWDYQCADLWLKVLSLWPSHSTTMVLGSNYNSRLKIMIFFPPDIL